MQSRAVGMVNTRNAVRVDSKTAARSKLISLVGADGLHSMVRTSRAGTREADRLVQLARTDHVPDLADTDVALQDHRRARKPRPVARGRLGSAVVVRLAVVSDFVRPNVRSK